MKDVLCDLLESFRDYDNELWGLYRKLDDLSKDIEFAKQCNDLEYVEELETEYNELKVQYDELEKQQELEYQDEIKQLPKPTNKTEFEGFRLDKTEPTFNSYMIPGQPDRDYYMKEGHYTDVYIAEMTPEQYLLLCGKYTWEARYDNVQDIYDSLSEKSHELIHQYAERMKQGEKAPMPYIDMKHETQEGRHRVFAALELGITSIPVLILI